MKQMIFFIFFALTDYGSTSSAQQPTTWTNPYFYYHYITPLVLPGQMVAANEMTGDHKQFSGHDDLSVQNLLGSHVVLLTACLREFIKNSQFYSTSTQLMANVIATVENLKKEMTGIVTKTDLAQTVQRLDETHASRVESIKNDLSLMTTVENLKKDTNGVGQGRAR
ncbi:hypothetical protein DAPPUDRAFT_342342 [Daphnia pulex]|uniref:Uncharacterized protein n=1 Tax=Daphnia pulex TaxID=6669 RepID=E9I5V6_DAPPU|nr:hypothetical protein DAPPUDRAFT_342342 [Daphnia pulex]|eukprot:EFX60624.1 hypothetical protein DAPPUDRAFT_342342 [Daphnia pulex]